MLEKPIQQETTFCQKPHELQHRPPSNWAFKWDPDQLFAVLCTPWVSGLSYTTPGVLFQRNWDQCVWVKLVVIDYTAINSSPNQFPSPANSFPWYFSNMLYFPCQPSDMWVRHRRQLLKVHSCQFPLRHTILFLSFFVFFKIILQKEIDSILLLTPIHFF